MNFLSWIEIFRNGKKEILYLTVKEIFSKIGEEKLGKFKKKEIFGHYPIKIFYDVPCGEGEHHMIYKFWDTKKLPPEIAEKMEKFDTYWGKCLERGYFDESDYRRVFRSGAPLEWQNRFAEKLLMDIENNISDEEFTAEDKLTMVLTICPEEHKAEAVQIIIRSYPTWEKLSYILVCAPVNLREMICDVIIKKNKLDFFDLIKLLDICPETKKETVFKLLIEKDFNEKDLRMISSLRWRQRAEDFLKTKKEDKK